MASPRVCVLRAPGTNCDAETAYAFESCGAKADRVHLFRLMERPGMLADYQILCVPGGFSYGDDLGSGVIFSAKMRGALKSSLSDFLAKDSLTLGICNGFQVLLKAGVLPDGTAGWDRHEKDDADATLTWNHNGKYTSRWIRCKVTTTNNAFLRDIDEIELPMAHAEGRLVVKDPATLSRWEEQGQQALVYQDWQAHHSGAERSPLICERWPSNPNGSANDLAGIGDASGRVLGLMPHPERFIFGHQHPNWTRLDLGEWGHGRKIFQNAVEYYN